jgi:hypothetical protein
MEGLMEAEAKRAMTMKQATESGWLSACSPNPPIGDWTGRLLAKCWDNKSMRLICFFEDEVANKKYQLTVYRSRDGRRYCPKDAGIDFSEIGIEGQEYFIEIELNSKGNPTWTHASLIDVNAT